MIKIGEVITWKEFSKHIQATEMRDSFGEIDDQEKRVFAAAGNFWQLQLLDPQTMKPASGKLANQEPANRVPIICQEDGDILDGRNRTMLARNTGKPVLAWVASEEDPRIDRENEFSLG